MSTAKGSPNNGSRPAGMASMTGFGEAHAETGEVRLAVEVRTINNRHLKLTFRSDAGYGVLEPQVEALVRKRLHRGAVHLGLRVTRQLAADAYRLNGEALQAYQKQLAELSPDSAPVPLESLLTLPGVVGDSSANATDPRERWPEVEAVVTQALDALEEMRLEEGRVLSADLLDNGRLIAAELAGIEQRSPAVAVGYRTRLVERVNQSLKELNVTVEPADLVREVAVFADRSDISEETVRLRSHLDQFEAAIDGAQGGRKLEFIAQEMGREVNTIGSKANDAEISARVVAIKTALERIREQVQNVE